MRTIETKGQFAKRKHRAPSCISGWIAEGRISSAALIGTGQRAMVWVERAEADLAAALEPSQQQAQVYPANDRSPLDIRNGAHVPHLPEEAAEDGTKPGQSNEQSSIPAGIPASD